MHRVLLALRLKSRDLTSSRLPLKERLNLRLPSQYILSLQLLPQRTKGKKGNVEDSGTSKAGESPAEETSLEEDDAFNPYDDALVSS
jgi:hypothetical protein